jgi:glucosamine--fructose-6-phosphate aminotransferase (isomerizing)
MSMRREIFEQPTILSHVLNTGWEAMTRIAGELESVAFDYVLIAARGTSDNAARYAKYVLAAHNGIPVALATPSLFTSYRQPPRLNGALVVGISQSGESPDLVAVLAEARRQGRPTLSITNAPHSPLGAESDLIIDIGAGTQEAVAATKTYTASLLAIAMLSTALGAEGQMADLERLPQHAEAVLRSEGQIAEVAEQLTDIGACAILGRGYNHATAFEWALKLQEVTYSLAHPYSTADFRHGPIAVVEPGFPILAIAATGPLLEDMTELLRGLTEEKRALTVAVSNSNDALDTARFGIPLPPVAEWLSPMPAIIAAQLFTYHLGKARGLDTDHPRGLNKVTRTT